MSITSQNKKKRKRSSERNTPTTPTSRSRDGDEEFFDALLDAAPGAEDGDDSEKSRQDDEEEADAVNAEMIVDVGLRRRAVRAKLNPTMNFFERVPGATEGYAAEEPPERQDKLGQRDGEREAANPFVVVAAKKQQGESANGGQENQNREQRSSGHQCTIPTTGLAAGQKKMTAMTTSAPMTTQTA